MTSSVPQSQQDSSDQSGAVGIASDETSGRMPGGETVLSVEDLHVEFPTPLGTVRALNGVDFSIRRGQVLGIVGESGCGKSVTGRAILRIVESPGRITGGRIKFRRRDPGRDTAADTVEEEAAAEGGPTRRGDASEVDLVSYDANSPALRSIRGRDISMIFQEPMTSLNPVFSIGSQIEEAVLLHQTNDKREAAERAVDILREVGMPDPEGAARSYPHQLSGGMRQRAMIAMGVVAEPAILIADEPTTALDVTTEAQILQLMRQLRADTNTSIMFITHSMGVVAQLCDEVVVMYLGRVMEHGTVDEIFYDPKHPYTQALLRSIPRIGSGRKEPLDAIAGSVPEAHTTLSGCPFHPRCPEAIPGTCDRVELAQTTIGPTHTVHCHLYPPDTAPAESTPNQPDAGASPSSGGAGRSERATAENLHE